MNKTLHTLIRTLSVAFCCFSVFGQEAGKEWQEVGAPKDVNEVLKFFPEGSTSGFAMVPMKDGTSLATSFFLPPGEGPWPVIFCKGFYGRFGMTRYAKGCEDGEFSFAIQDARGVGDSEGKGSYDPASFDAHISDTTEALVWIAAQPWCNDQIQG